MTLNEIVVDASDGAVDGSLTPDPWWRHPDDGRVVSEQQLIRVGNHRRAWRLVAAGPSARLVLERGAEVLPESVVAVEELLAADVDGAVVVLGEPVGSAYVVGPAAAERLVALAGDVAVATLEGLLAQCGLKLVRTEPALSAAPAVLDGHRSAVAHFHVMNLDDPVVSPPGDVVLRLPDSATVLGSPGELLAAFADCNAAVVVPDGPDRGAVMGLAGAIRDGVEPLIDIEHQLFLPSAAAACWMNGRVTDVDHGTRPGVVLGPVGPTDGGERDLVRVLRYDDAIDPREQCQAVASDIFLLPFWTPAFCATIIRAAEAMEAWASDPDDAVPGSEISLAAISPRLFAHVEDHVAGWIVPQLRRQWPHVQFAGLQDAFVIKYTALGPSHLPVHHDISQVSAAVRLNDGFEGGRLEFARQRYDNAAVPIGSMLTWPSLVTHPHRSTPVTGGAKYSLTVWWNLPESYRRT